MRLGLSAGVLLRMTAHELLLAAEHYREREDRADRRLAWLSANLMNCWVTPRVTPQQLLGTPEVSQEDVVRETLRVHYGEAAAEAFTPLSPSEKLDALLGGDLDRLAVSDG